MINENKNKEQKPLESKKQMPSWRNWQTRWPQTPVGNRAGSGPSLGY